MTPHHYSIQKHERGVAVVTALLLATLAVAIVTSFFWHQQVQVRTIENQRLQQQAKWVLHGALDWAKLILREDAKQSTADHLNEPWSTPLLNTRLDNYIESGETNEKINGITISGHIFDAQSRFNLNNLIAEGGINSNEVMTFRRLLNNLNLNTALADNVAKTMLRSQSGSENNEAGGRNIKLLFVEDLHAVPGFSADIVARLKDYVALLPRFTAINANTASAEVLAARIEGLSLADAAALVASRDQAWFRDHADVVQHLPRQAQSPGASKLAVTTSYFLVHGKIRLDRASQAIQALIERGNRATATIWIRDYE